MTKTGVATAAIRDLQTLLNSGAVGGLSDEQLLERFLATRDGAAFEVLVLRHGPMVWGVCRRALGDFHDAQDAFQATFLVLARKAASVVPRGMVGNWLYGVARRTAIKAKGMRARRRLRERTVAEMPEPEPTIRPSDDRLALLDLELARLPQKYRIPIVFCDLEGTTQEEAARRLGCPVGTLSGRLWRARAMLAKRLTRRGLTLSGGSVALLLAQDTAMASMQNSLVATTVLGALSYAAGRTVASSRVSVEVVLLAEGVIKAMLFAHWKIATLILTTLGVLGSWTALMAYPPGSGKRRAEDERPAAQASSGSRVRLVRRLDKAGTVLRGRVVDEAGRPLAGAKVVLYSGFGTRKRGQEMTTGENGVYRFDPLKTGSMIKDEKANRWDLYVGVQIFHSTHVGGDGLSWWDIQVPTIDGHEQIKDFMMVPGGRLDGRVLDVDTGKPLPGLDLRVQSPSPRRVKFGRYATTDKDGRFTLPALFPGDFVIDVNSAALNYPVLGVVKIEAKKTMDVSYTMKAGLETLVAKVLSSHVAEAKLDSLKAFTETIRETRDDGKATTTKHFIQIPDQYRCEIKYPGDDKILICIHTSDGMKRWYKHPNGNVEEAHLFGLELPVEHWLDVLRFFGPRAVLRLKDTDHKLTLLDEIEVGGRTALGIRLVKTKPPVRLDLKMYFDKETGLLLKEENALTGAATFFKDYEDLEGIPVARKTTLKADEGRQTTEGEVVEFKSIAKFDSALFQKP